MTTKEVYCTSGSVHYKRENRNEIATIKNNHRSCSIEKNILIRRGKKFDVGRRRNLLFKEYYSYPKYLYAEHFILMVNHFYHRRKEKLPLESKVTFIVLVLKIHLIRMYPAFWCSEIIWILNNSVTFQTLSIGILFRVIFATCMTLDSLDTVMINVLR